VARPSPAAFFLKLKKPVYRESQKVTSPEELEHTYLDFYPSKSPKLSTSLNHGGCPNATERHYRRPKSPHNIHRLSRYIDLYRRAAAAASTATIASPQAAISPTASSAVPL
jgi:hypothetical protein